VAVVDGGEGGRAEGRGDGEGDACILPLWLAQAIMAPTLGGVAFLVFKDSLPRGESCT